MKRARCEHEMISLLKLGETTAERVAISCSGLCRYLVCTRCATATGVSRSAISHWFRRRPDVFERVGLGWWRLRKETSR